MWTFSYKVIEPVIFATRDRADWRFKGCLDSLFVIFLPSYYDYDICYSSLQQLLVLKYVVLYLLQNKIRHGALLFARIVIGPCLGRIWICIRE